MVSLKQRAGRAWELSRSAPLGVRIALAVLIAYLLMPFDLIPDFIPVLGQLDDILVAGLLLGYIARRAPELAEILDLRSATKGDTLSVTTKGESNGS